MRSSGRRFLIDGSMARGGGGFTYLVNILPHLAEQAPSDSFRVLVRNPELAAAISRPPNVQVDLLPPADAIRRFSFSVLRAQRIAQQWPADLYYSVGEHAPFRTPCPKIAAFRNPNVFTRLDQGWPIGQRIRLRLLKSVASLSARTAARIVFVSHDSGRWIGDAIGLPASRRVVIHHGIDLVGWSTPPLERPPEAPSGPFLLSTSSVYRYKNYVRLIEAYQRFAERVELPPDLVIIGENIDREYSEEMEIARRRAGQLMARIHLVGRVPYAEVRGWYHAASLFVFPSYLETFGHPLLEAMASGLPLVASDIPVFREVAGDAALYANPHDSSALADAMYTAYTDASIREALVARGQERVRRFSWAASAKRLLDMFDEVLRDPS